MQWMLLNLNTLHQPTKHLRINLRSLSQTATPASAPFMPSEISFPAPIPQSIGANPKLSSTTSVSETNYSCIEENGRQYHSFRNGQYVLPNDAQEQERLDLQNHLFSLTLEGKLYLAPLNPKKLHNVLDIGTGTGIWAIEFADLHPQAKITGTDLSAVQPKYVPSNLQFEICDAEEEWMFNTKFDYIHGRMLTVCFKDVKEVFRNALNALRPGGWLEMQDANAPARSDDGSTDGTAWVAWWDNLIASGKKLGRPFGTEPPNYARYMEEVGFVDVHVEVRRWPFGPWMKQRQMKDIGLWARANAIDGLQATALAVMTRGGGKTKQEVEEELVAVRKDLMNSEIHSYLPV